VRIAPKICQGQLQTIYSEFPKFHPNPFTSGGVIAKRVNTVEMCHKVFPILGEALRGVTTANTLLLHDNSTVDLTTAPAVMLATTTTTKTRYYYMTTAQ